MARQARSLLSALVAAVALAGCVGAPVETASTPAPTWDTSAAHASPLERGPYEVLPVERLDLEGPDGTRIATAVWRPATPAGVQVPVIVDAGPYFGGGVELPRFNWTQGLMIDGIVPHGYAFAQVAVRGTSSSGGCMDAMSLEEQADIDAAVTFYGSQPWSDGGVALLGISYDGSTPWMAATFGNPHLKTIVPISGIVSARLQSYPNGTAWAFGPLMQPFYWQLGNYPEAVGGRRDAADVAGNFACAAAVQGAAHGAGPAAGPAPGAVDDAFWEDRDFRGRVLENYRGSVFLVHGLQDWRVPPHNAFPFVNELQDRGLRVKMLLGQWWHTMPDHPLAGEHRRWDFGETLLKWFDAELKGLPVDSGAAVDVEDDAGAWRTESRWPPADATFRTLHLGATTLSDDATSIGEAVLFNPSNAIGFVRDSAAHRMVWHEVFYPSPPTMEPPFLYRAAMGPLPHDLRIAGLAQLHATVVPLTPVGGRLYAELVDVTPVQGERVVAHAVMDLRYHDGGESARDLQPGVPVVARMQFFPADSVIPSGNSLELRLTVGAGYAPQRGNVALVDNFVDAPSPATLRWGDGTSILRLPVVERDVGDGRYPGEP